MPDILVPNTGQCMVERKPAPKYDEKILMYSTFTIHLQETPSSIDTGFNSLFPSDSFSGFHSFNALIRGRNHTVIQDSCRRYSEIRHTFVCGISELRRVILGGILGAPGPIAGDSSCEQA